MNFMIKNNKQYQITGERLSAFRRAVAVLKEKSDVNPLLKEIQINALIAQAEILEEEMEEYNLSKANTGLTAETR
jgi:hypothetical protein